MNRTKKLALLAALAAVALTIFVAESQIPPVVPVPGVKLGLANIVTMVTMLVLGRKEAGAVRSSASSWAAPLLEASPGSFSPRRAGPQPTSSCACSSEYSPKSWCGS